MSLTLVAPVARRRLYWTARAVFISDLTQVTAFDRVFAAVFGAGAMPAPADEHTRIAPEPVDAEPGGSPAQDAEVPRGERPTEPEPAGSAAAAAEERDDKRADDDPIVVPTLASAEELIREKRFEALTAPELAGLYQLMSALTLATPRRRTRRAEPFRRGDRIDMRRTLRASLRTGGDPIRLARRRRRILPRRIVLLCDISGSMEPYARAYLQFLTCAAATGPRNEVFVFATRLTRLTRALGSRNPERAIQHAATTAPDWSSGTRIGDALRSFNDRHGRRGMARGAVVVILSDGWERGDPSLVEREMQRLSRLAYRIVWVNPRASAAGFSPQAGGMAAALPHCDALVSGHSLAALHEVVAAIAAQRRDDAQPDATWRPPALSPAPGDDEPWASATGWAGSAPGSSVAMPSGYGPRRGRTTPGWGRG